MSIPSGAISFSDSMIRHIHSILCAVLKDAV